MPATRFSPNINRLRAALRGLQGPSLLAAVRREIELLPAAALVADNTQRYVAANTAAAELTGYDQSELEQLTVMDLTPLPHSSTGSHLWEEFISRGGQRGEYELVPKRGSPRHVRYWAFASVAPGLHVSLIVPVDSEQRSNS